MDGRTADLVALHAQQVEGEESAEMDGGTADLVALHAQHVEEEEGVALHA